MYHNNFIDFQSEEYPVGLSEPDDVNASIVAEFFNSIRNHALEGTSNPKDELKFNTSSI